jgi:hypothetical protein
VFYIFHFFIPVKAEAEGLEPSTGLTATD